MKCPFLKKYLTLPEIVTGDIADWKGTYRHLDKSAGLKEEFQNCIKTECIAWNDKKQKCNYFQKSFYLKIRRK